MKYFLIAGEASGDLHASKLIAALKEIDRDADFLFLGGDLMQESASREPLIHYRDMAFMGFVNVLLNSKKVLRNIRITKEKLRAFKPDVLILIDYPSFNLRIAEFAKKELDIPVHYYISPKLWAWKTYRIKSIKKWVDKMFTIFPFETEFYGKFNYPVHYVGNPSVESVREFLESDEEQLQGGKKTDKPVIALLPGSRKQEIASCLPLMLESALNFPAYRVVVSGAPGVETSFYHQFFKNKGVEIVFDSTYTLLKRAELAVVNSGTATLECALLDTPQVVVYKMAFGRLAMLLKPLFIKIKYVSLVNIITGREVVKELLAHHFTVEKLSDELRVLIEKPEERQKMLASYNEIRFLLGENHASRYAAKGVYESLTEPSDYTVK